MVGAVMNTDEVVLRSVVTGKINLRVPLALHEALKAGAEEQGVSLNRWVSTVLAGAIGFSPQSMTKRAGGAVNAPAPDQGSTPRGQQESQQTEQ
jgi:hypothetical protein